jgi:hypothetical protein
VSSHLYDVFIKYDGCCAWVFCRRKSDKIIASQRSLYSVSIACSIAVHDPIEMTPTVTLQRRCLLTKHKNRLEIIQWAIVMINSVELLAFKGIFADL